MAKLNISNKNKPLPILRSFKGAKAENFISCQLAELVMNQTYYYNGDSSQPVVGDSLFNDINGTIPFSGLRFIQYRVDANNRYFLKLNNNTIVDILSCKIVNFIEFDALEQIPSEICTEDGFYPDNLTNNAETFYHDGSGEFPIVGDKVYLSEDRFDTLENFTGLFNILNNTYYYLTSNNLGVITNITTCKKIISIPTRSSSLKHHRLNDSLYNLFLCENPNNSFNDLYYKSENEGLPEEGSLIYSDFNLTNLITESSYYVGEERTGRNEITITSLLVDEEGKASYTNCKKSIITVDPDPEVDTFYFNGILLIPFCRIPSQSDSSTRLYYEESTSTGQNFSLPSVGTEIYLDEALTQPYDSSSSGIYVYLYRDFSNNTTTYALITNNVFNGTRICNDPIIPGGGGISDEPDDPAIP